MQADSLKQLVVGVILIVIGFGLIGARKAIRRADDKWNERAPWLLQTHGPRGDAFQIFIIIFASFLVLVGTTNVILPLVRP